MNKKVVKELNAYLKGEYMAIKSYQDFIERTKDPSIRQKLQSIRQDHERHAVRISERISNLGGRPVKGAGFMGIMSDIRNLMKKNSSDTQFIIEDAGRGEYRGIQMAEEIVKGDLDPDSRNLVNKILDEDRSHVEKLKGFVQ
ncbi:MAG: DUF2383 domain-containing protein [Gracilibacteraceae bacterium]|jgi:bacterioferritin|nr:DUF2383 domain-containing protein [Gracilibacteraceae bacterium]